MSRLTPPCESPLHMHSCNCRLAPITHWIDGNLPSRLTMRTARACAPHLQHLRTLQGAASECVRCAARFCLVGDLGGEAARFLAGGVAGACSDGSHLSCKSAAGCSPAAGSNLTKMRSNTLQLIALPIWLP